MKPDYVVRYRTCGYECFVLNKLVSAKASPSRVRIRGGKMYFSLNSKEAPAAERALTGAGVAFEKVGEHGLTPALKKLKSKAALLITLAAAAAGTLLYAFSVDSVKVPGLEKVSENEVRNAVYAELDSPFVPPGTQFTELERKLLDIDGVAYASVVKSGRDIIVNIVEELPDIPLLDTQSPVPLPAKESGRITRIVVLNGTGRVKPGDEVVKGEILIEPYVVSAEGEYKQVRAMGIVEAEVRRTEEVPMPEDGSAAELILARKEAFESGLEEGAKLIDYSFEIKKVDKTSYLSIYYDIITRI